MNTEKQPTVAITGMNARPDNPGPGLAVARCIREAEEFNGRIVGLGYDVLDPGLYLNSICDAGYLLPYPSAGEEVLLERLQMIHEREHIDVLIPCLDAELPSMVRLTPLIEEMGIRMFLPTAEQLRLRNKDRLEELAAHAGIHAPETQPITQAGFFYNCQEEGWEFPFVVKGLFYDAQIVQNADEGAAAFRRISAQWGLPVLVQRFLKGEEVNLSALGDGSGRMLGGVMMRKLALTDKGKAWAGISVDDERLYAASKALIHAIQWRGPLEVEIMRDEHGDYQLIEINPRFPAWIYLSVGVKQNLPYALLKLALGQTLPELSSKAVPGTIFIRHAEENIVSLEQYEHMVVSAGL